jgi:hypothetical protein
MPWVGFEPTIPVFERAKTVHASDRCFSTAGRLSSYRKKNLPGSGLTKGLSPRGHFDYSFLNVICSWPGFPSTVTNWPTRLSAWRIKRGAQIALCTEAWQHFLRSFFNLPSSVCSFVCCLDWQYFPALEENSRHMRLSCCVSLLGHDFHVSTTDFCEVWCG